MSPDRVPRVSKTKTEESEHWKMYHETFLFIWSSDGDDDFTRNITVSSQRWKVVPTALRRNQVCFNLLRSGGCLVIEPIEPERSWVRFIAWNFSWRWRGWTIVTRREIPGSIILFDISIKLLSNGFNPIAIIGAVFLMAIIMVNPNWIKYGRQVLLGEEYKT